MIDTYCVPISAKGIIFDDGRVWLRLNQRNEWELPGGKIDDGEQPEETVVREIREELGFDIVVKEIIQAYLYNIDVSPDETKGVLVVSYFCDLMGKTGEFEIEWEEGKAEFKSFDMDEIKDLKMPDFYKKAIKKAWLVAGE